MKNQKPFFWEHAPVIRFNTLGSTNDHALGLISEDKPPEGTIISARKQTEGKGYGTNAWESEKDKNLTISLILYPGFLEAGYQFYLNKVISLGIIDMLREKIPHSEFSVKWPNDVYAGNQKIAGILIRNIISGEYLKQSVAGIGLNVNQEVFKSDAPNPVSMKNLTQRAYDTHEILEKLKKDIFYRYLQVAEGNYGIIDQLYWNNLYRNAGYHSFKKEDDIFQARIKEINSIGQLVLETKQGKLIIANFKEVEFIL